jgi:uncharacterized membrane protein
MHHFPFNRFESSTWAVHLGNESRVAHDHKDSKRQHGHRPSALVTAPLLANNVLEEDRMSDLVVIAFPTEAKAEEVRQKLLAMQKEYLLELGDAVVAVKDEKGNIKLNQMINTTAAGAVGGAFWGTLIGLIFLMPLAGAALGAASGAVSGALTDLGISNKFMKDTAAAIQPGTAALFVLVRKVTADKVLEGLKGEGGTVLKTSLDHTKEAALQAALAGVQSAVPAPPS